MPHTPTRRTIRILAIGVGLILLLLALLWVSNTVLATHSSSCSGGYHHHDSNPHTCHKHCQNGMSAHNSGHGEDCAVNNPSQLPGNNEMRGAWSTR